MSQTFQGLFRQVFDGFVAAVHAPARGVMLRNGIPWLEVLQVMLGNVVVATPATTAVAGSAEAQRQLGDNA